MCIRDSPTRVRHLGNLLFIVVYSLLSDEKKELERKRLIASHQSDLNEKIQIIKDEQNVEFYSYETEKELLLKVRNGDVIGAKNILNDMICLLYTSMVQTYHHLHV